MSNIRHLIENLIYHMKHGEDADDILNKRHNLEMLAECYITRNELIEIADEVVFGLYNGKFPTFPDDRMTNGDYLRSMTDEQLARQREREQFFSLNKLAETFEFKGFDGLWDSDRAYKEQLEWLKKECEET